MSKSIRNELDEIKKLMNFEEYREPTIVEYLRHYKRGNLGERHIEIVIEIVIERERVEARKAFEFGYSLASDNIHNEVLHYLADTRRKTIDWQWLKKRVPRTEFGDKEATYLDRLAQLKKEPTKRGLL